MPELEEWLANPTGWLETCPPAPQHRPDSPCIDDAIDAIRQHFPKMMPDRSHWIMAASAMRQAAGSQSDLHALHAYVSLRHALAVEGWAAPG